MPKVNIYLPDDLAEAVKDTGLPLSAVCQRALEQAVRRVTAIREIVTGQADGLPDPPVLNFTARAMGMLESARSAAEESGLAGAGTGHVLLAILADDNSLAVRVLNALEITSHQVRSELARRQAASATSPAGHADDTGRNGGAGFDPQAAAVLELAAAESSGLGNNYVGSEHLLLGLVAEPDGVAGSVLRSLGADLRVTRRMVAAALAGWAARGAKQQQQQPGGRGDAAAAVPTHAGPTAEELAVAVRTELTPVLARIERLEASLAN